MKKLLISLMVFFSSFLLLNKIKAQSTYDVIYDYNDTTFNTLENNYSIVEDVIDYINEHNTRNFGAVITYQRRNNEYRLRVMVKQGTSPSGAYFKDTQYLWLQSGNYVYNMGNAFFTKSDGSSYSCFWGTTNCQAMATLNLTSYTESDINTFYTELGQLFSTNLSNNGAINSSSTFNSNDFDVFNTTQYTSYVWCNLPIKYMKGPNVSYDNRLTGIYFEDETIAPGEEITTYNTWRENQIQYPIISFTSQNYTSNNDIYKKDVTIDFGVIDNENYYYMYLDTNENIWHNLYLTTSTSYTLSIYDNTNIIAQIINKSDNTIYSNASFLVNDITSDLKINIENIPVRNENENNILFYQTNIKYFSDNRNNYIYDYTTSNYYVNNDYEYITIDNNSSEVTFRNYDNLVIIARIKDLQGNILYTKTSEINSLISEPIITFTEIDNYSSSGFWHNEYISSAILNINYGYIDTTKYIYLYKKYDDENWTTFNPLNFNDKTVNINLEENTNIIARVLNKSDNTVFTQSSYTIYKISNGNENSSFLSPLKDIFKKAQWETIINFFTNIFNTIIDTKLFPYIVLIIITSIFLMLMNSLK